MEIRAYRIVGPSVRTFIATCDKELGLSTENKQRIHKISAHLRVEERLSHNSSVTNIDKHSHLSLCVVLSPLLVVDLWRGSLVQGPISWAERCWPFWFLTTNPLRVSSPVWFMEVVCWVVSFTATLLTSAALMIRRKLTSFSTLLVFKSLQNVIEYSDKKINMLFWQHVDTSSHKMKKSPVAQGEH